MANPIVEHVGTMVTEFMSQWSYGEWQYYRPKVRNLALARRIVALTSIANLCNKQLQSNADSPKSNSMETKYIETRKVCQTPFQPTSI